MTIPNSPLGDDSAFPNRPSHPDFARLVETILKYDAAMGEAKDDDERDRIYNERFAPTGIDMESASYVATQRAMRALGIVTKLDLMLRLTEVSQLGAAWLEGLLIGAELKGKP